MTVNKNIATEFKVKVYLNDGTTKIDTINGTLNGVTEKYNNSLTKGFIQNFEIYVRVHGSYQLIFEAVEEFGI